MAANMGVHLVVALALLALISGADAKCPKKFTRFNFGCYFISPERVGSAKDAFDTCNSLGGYLVNVDSDLENDFVVDQIKKHRFEGYWIGGLYQSDFIRGSRWVWEKKYPNGFAYLPMNDGRYSNWGPSEPNNMDVQGQEYNVAIMVAGVPKAYAWYSENSDRKTSLKGMSYVCETSWTE